MSLAVPTQQFIFPGATVDAPAEVPSHGLGSWLAVLIDHMARRRGLVVTGVGTYTLPADKAPDSPAPSMARPGCRIQLVVETTATDTSELDALTADVARLCPALRRTSGELAAPMIAWAFVRWLAPQHAQSAAEATWGSGVWAAQPGPVFHHLPPRGI